jgi:hypothetical protein
LAARVINKIGVVFAYILLELLVRLDIVLDVVLAVKIFAHWLLFIAVVVVVTRISELWHTLTLYASRFHAFRRHGLR